MEPNFHMKGRQPIINSVAHSQELGFSVSPSPIETSREIKELLDRLGMKQEEFARLIRTSGPSVSRWIRGSGTKPSSRIAQKLGRIKAIIDIIVNANAMPKSDLKHFFSRPNNRLKQLRPIDYLDTDEGFEAVKDILESALTGGYI